MESGGGEDRIGLKVRFRSSLFLPLFGLLVITLLFVPPRGDFPLNDDWIYAQTVQNIMETGRYEPNVYADPVYIVHAYWGALVCRVFGFSFTALRFSTLLVALLGSWLAARCAKEAGLDQASSLLIGLLLFANPIALNLSYTFMTDIPFLMLSTASGLLFLRALNSGSATMVLLGSAVAAVAFFVRQFGILLPFAYLATAAFLIVTQRRPFAPRHVAALAGPWLVVIALDYAVPKNPLGATLEWDWGALGHNPLAISLTVLRHFIEALVYFGLFAFPALLVFIPRAAQTLRKTGPRAIIAIALFAALSAFVYFRSYPHGLPDRGNVLYDFGVGPLLLPGSVIDGHIAAPFQIGMVWWVVSALCLLAGLVFFAATTRHIVDRRAGSEVAGGQGATAQDVFLFLWGLAMAVVLILPAIPIRFDRYFLMFLVPWSILAVKYLGDDWKGRGRQVAFSGVALMYLVSVVCLRDYMAWNEARREALDKLQSEYSASPDEINGGYEFNGWSNSQGFAEDSLRRGTRHFGPKGWWIVRDDYAVSFHPLEHFEQIDEVRYFSPLGASTRSIRILKRTSKDPDFP